MPQKRVTGRRPPTHPHTHTHWKKIGAGLLQEQRDHGGSGHQEHRASCQGPRGAPVRTETGGGGGHGGAGKRMPSPSPLVAVGHHVTDHIHISAYVFVPTPPFHPPTQPNRMLHSEFAHGLPNDTIYHACECYCVSVLSLHTAPTNRQDQTNQIEPNQTKPKQQCPPTIHTHTYIINRYIHTPTYTHRRADREAQAPISPHRGPRAAAHALGPIAARHPR